MSSADECIYWNSEESIDPPTQGELYEMLHEKKYIFLDEIQEISGWERVVRKLLAE